MAIPDGVTKVVYSGSLAGTLERWAFSLYFTGYTNGGANDLVLSDWDTGAPNTQFRDAFLAMMATADSFTQLDSYFYTGGVAVNHQTLVVSHAGTGAGTGLLPKQCAVALTLRTAVSTRRTRGRIYLPCTDIPISGSTGLALSTTINNAVDKLANMLDSHKIAGLNQPVVVSQGLSVHRDGSPNTTWTPFTTTITSVDADYVVDTQRRRRNKLTSARHSAAVVGT